MLEMGRLDAGAVVVRVQPLPAWDVVTAALERAPLVVAGHRIDLQEGAAPILLADPQLAETALANLLENAAKYAPAGSVIGVSAGCDSETGWIEVVDEGPGFPEPIEPLFEKFVRGVRGDGRAPGTGLGLAIARGFAEAQGGRVEAFNRTDHNGARVRMTMPLVTDPFRPATPPKGCVGSITMRPISSCWTWGCPTVTA
jgi:two-component system sensor histidine kinase KdpD